MNADDELGRSPSYHHPHMTTPGLMAALAADEGGSGQLLLHASVGSEVEEEVRSLAENNSQLQHIDYEDMGECEAGSGRHGAPPGHAG